MKTLIIHPKDSSTSFLDIVYNPIPNKTVISGGVSKQDLKKLIETHDRIMMMGHGSPYGLFSVGQFPDSVGGYIIDPTFIGLLREKNDNVYIWCNADQFVRRYGLGGFYSGMFISEIAEATYCGIPGTDQDLIDESNYGFCEILSRYINHPKNMIHENVIKDYGKIAEENPVAYYNILRLYQS